MHLVYGSCRSLAIPIACNCIFREPTLIQTLLADFGGHSLVVYPDAVRCPQLPMCYTLMRLPGRGVLILIVLVREGKVLHMIFQISVIHPEGHVSA